MFGFLPVDPFALLTKSLEYIADLAVVFSAEGGLVI
jgi:hypothetical protein